MLAGGSGTFDRHERCAQDLESTPRSVTEAPARPCRGGKRPALTPKGRRGDREPKAMFVAETACRYPSICATGEGFSELRDALEREECESLLCERLRRPVLALEGQLRAPLANPVMQRAWKNIDVTDLA